MSAAGYVGFCAGLGVGAAILTGCATAAADSGSADAPAASASSSPHRGPRSASTRAVKRPAVAPSHRASLVRSSTVNPSALPPVPAPREIWVGVASSVMGLVQNTLRAVGIAAYLGPTQSTLNQTLALNGYNLVPSSTETVTSFYGQWASWPGGPTLVQGQQQYAVVDPVTNLPVGNFDALVSTGSPFTIRSRYVELLVTANDGVNVGTGPGQIPPVGSLIASFDLIGGFGWSYSALASSPANVVSFALTTPFGDIPLPFGFDAASGIADHTVTNQPIDLANGYTITAADPGSETYIGTSGFLPYYTTVQARQVFDLRDSTGAAVGSFEGVTTPTADVMGVHTQAILVTKVLDGTPGVLPGDIPPVGSVFNVMYESNGTYVIHSALPSTSGDAVSTILVDADKVSNIGTFPMNLLDAAGLPPVKRLPTSGGYSILPTSELLPSGVNGLPPRDVQVQGYQQFGVYDSTGVQQGGFDADVCTQLDMYGNYSQAILVTKVTGDAAGVPPVGSIFNYVYFGDSGFGTYYSSQPTTNGARTSFKILTPLFDLPTWSMYNASAGLTDVSFYDPFVG